MGFDPVTASAIAMGSMAAGTGLSAYGTIQGGRNAERASRINARIQEGQADQIDSQTAANIASSRRSFDKFRGALRGDLAAYGGSSSSGTGLLMAQEAARQAKLDELNIEVEGTNQASATRMGAQMTRYEGRARKSQAVMGGLGQALNGFSRMAQMQA